MFELPSVHYRGDNLTTLEDTSISLRDVFIIDSSADGGYVYNTTDFCILRSVLASAFPAFTTMEVRELETSTKILCSETTKQSMSVVQIIGTVLGMNQLVQSLILTPSSNYNGDGTIDLTIYLFPENSSNDTYSSSFTLYVRPVDEDPRLIVSPTVATAYIGYSNSLPSISVFDPDFLSACRSEFVGDAAGKMTISVSLTVESGYLLVPVLHDLYDGFYVPVSWQLYQKTALVSGYPPLVNAVLSNIKYLVDGSLKREDSLVINVARKDWIVVNTTEVRIQLVSHENVFDTV
jgi:hypothetical protein